MSSAYLANNTGLFQEVLLNLGTLNDPRLCEVDVNVLAKSAGVVVANGLGIAKRCEEKGNIKSVLLEYRHTYTHPNIHGHVHA